VNAGRALRAAVAAGALLLGRFSAAADPPKATATLTPEQLSAGQSAILQIEVTGGFRLSQAPSIPLTNLEIVAGPSLENRFEWINGKSSSRTILVYRVRAREPGRATVGPIRLSEASGRSVVTDPLSILVERAAAATETPAPESIDDPALVARLEPPNPYVGQQAVWTLYLVTRGQATQGEVQSLPDFRGFWAEDLERETNVEPKIWNIRGVLWRAYPMLRKALFANRGGTLSIGPAHARVAVRRMSFDFFDSPFGDAPPVERVSGPVTVACRPKPVEPDLPVGTLALKASLDRTRAPAGGALTLTAQLSGDGRLAGVPPPPLEIPGARISEPESRLVIKRGAERLSSVRTWQWVVTPLAPGVLAIPPLRVATFDPGSGRRVDLASSPLRASVEPAAPVAAVLPPAAAVPAPAPRTASAPRGWLAGAGITVLAAGLVAIGFWAGRRRLPALPAAEEVPELSPEERLGRLLDSLSDAASRRAGDAPARLAEWRRRLEEIRFAPILSSRHEAADALEREIREASARWSGRDPA
jgi:hypothetical protein